jgi:predicted dithiol-disulfide oxidoreductase (DUF899 family)
MTAHKTGTHEEWLAARLELLDAEKEHTRRGDELARRRQELPWVPVSKEFRFETGDGTVTLADLFAGRSQLLVYHFMFGPEYTAGCPVCTSGADTYNGAQAHLHARDVNLVLVSRAPLDRLLEYRERMGWTLPWVSQNGDFNADFGAAFTEEQIEQFLESDDLGAMPEVAARCGVDPAHFITEAPVLSAFALEDGDVYQTYSTTARGLEPLMAYYGVLDLAPRGRDEGSPPEMWIRRHDEYGD